MSDGKLVRVIKFDKRLTLHAEMFIRQTEKPDGTVLVEQIDEKGNVVDSTVGREVLK